MVVFPAVRYATEIIIITIIIIDHLISTRRQDVIIINNKKENWKYCGLCFVKLKEREKKDKCFDLPWEVKKLWNMKVTIIPIMIGTLDTFIEGLLKGLEDLKLRGRVETIQTTTRLRSARILRRILETLGDLLSLKPQ